MSSSLCRDSLLSCLQPTQSKPSFDDRIEIENPGVLIPGLSLDDLPRGISRLRNRVISRVFRELGLIEQWGSGIPVILEEAASQHLPPPLFEEVGLRFRVTLPLDQASSPPQGQSRPRGAESGAESRAVSGAESLAEGGLAEMVLQALADGPLSKSEIAHALGRDSVSGALAMMFKPSRSHWIAAPAIKTLPSSAYSVSPPVFQPMVVSRPVLEAVAFLPVFMSRKQPVP